MTQPAAEQPRRIPLDELTSDQYDALHTRLWGAETARDAWAAKAEKAEVEVERLRATSQQLLTNGGNAIEERAWAQQYAEERAERAEAEAKRWKAAWQLAHDRSAKHRDRADEAEADLRITNINLKNERGHNLSIQHDYHHALTAVYAMQRVRAVAHRWAAFRPYDDAAAELREAIGAPDTCRGRGKCTWMEPNSTDRERADRAEKRITLARAEAQEWQAHFLDSGDAPATHALAMVLLLLDQQQGKT